MAFMPVEVERSYAARTSLTNNTTSIAPPIFFVYEPF
jgi:hypothetical protein